MKRRTFATLATLSAARSLLRAAAPAERSLRLGLCTFSCKIHWEAARKGKPEAAFSDARGFYDYSRKLGGDGVQASVRDLSPDAARELRSHVEETGGYLEGDVRLPKSESDLADFEREIVLTKEAGATVARVILMGGRRYEVFQSLDEFRTFRADGIRRLQLAEPIARKHRIKLAMENHKDLLVAEQLEVIKKIDSEWLGVLVDTGNNLAMCEDPYEVVETLAPYALSCHLKDMAVQPADDGFLLSEIPFGQGFLDLKRIVRTLATANPKLTFHVEMATRDPLHVPCQTDAYWRVFPERREDDLQRTLVMVDANPLTHEPPSVKGLDSNTQLAAEEANNRACLSWTMS